MKTRQLKVINNRLKRKFSTLLRENLILQYKLYKGLVKK